MPDKQLMGIVLRYLAKIDRRSFLLLRDGEHTFDQVRAKLDRLHYGVQYSVLDDFKAVLPAHVYEAAGSEGPKDGA